jgi:hypothetical protein
MHCSCIIHAVCSAGRKAHGGAKEPSRSSCCAARHPVHLRIRVVSLFGVICRRFIRCARLRHRIVSPATRRYSTIRAAIPPISSTESCAPAPNASPTNSQPRLLIATPGNFHSARRAIPACVHCPAGVEKPPPVQKSADTGVPGRSLRAIREGAHPSRESRLQDSAKRARLSAVKQGEATRGGEREIEVRQSGGVEVRSCFCVSPES